MLTEREATALLIGARLLAADASDDLRVAANQAIGKIVASVGDATREPLQHLDREVSFGWAPERSSNLDLGNPLVAQLRYAIASRNAVRLQYISHLHATSHDRDVEPQHLAYSGGVWYLGAFCRLRQSERTFRLDRIEELTVLTERVIPRAPVPAAPSLGPIEVIVRFGSADARWVREDQHWSCVAETAEDNEVTCVYRVESLDDLIPWLLGWGAKATVVSPQQLRSRLLEEINSMVEKLT